MTESTLPDSQPYDYVFRSTSDGIVIADKDGLIHKLNPAGAGMLAVTLEEVMGKKDSEGVKE